MAGSRTKVFYVHDANGTKLTVTERVVSAWQRDLRLKVDGPAYGDGFRAGARHSRSFAIKSPDELIDLSERLSGFLASHDDGERMYIGVHNRYVGKLTRADDGIVWEIDCRYRTPELVLVDETALRQLIEFSVEYD